MIGGKRRLYFFGALCGVFAYQFIFPLPMGREIAAVPVWTAPADGALAAYPGNAAARAAGFSLAGFLGYIDENGGILFREKVDYDAAVHDEFFVNYSALPRNLMTRSPDGTFIGTIGESGYPFIRGDRLFLLSADGFALSEWTVNGDLVWEKKFSSLITAVDAGPETAIVGLLAGGVHLLGKDGAEIFTSPAEGSRYPVALQVGISGGDRILAAVSGIGPQKLSVFEKTPKEYRLLESRELPSGYRRAVKGRFFSPDDFFVFEQPGGIAIYHPRTKRLVETALPGILLALADYPGRGLLFALTEKGEKLHCTGFLPSGKKVLQFDFPKSPSFFLRRSGDFLLLGLGNRLFRIDMRIG